MSETTAEIRKLAREVIEGGIYCYTCGCIRYFVTNTMECEICGDAQTAPDAPEG